jgi:hypothetical protein
MMNLPWFSDGGGEFWHSRLSTAKWKKVAPDARNARGGKRVRPRIGWGAGFLAEPGEAEACFQRALNVAQAQSAGMWELLAASNLASLLTRRARHRGVQ